ncbi:MAG: FHA domain-containing protein [Cyanothece sp. SIO1E1]|nr:FHA domain-containing protein [Cyanothece sp. SIO1E1]
MLAKPAVVRIISECSGTYVWKPDGQNIRARIPFNLDFIGTGFFIDPNGYIVTSARVLESKEDCRKRLIDNIRRTLNQKSFLSEYSEEYITDSDTGEFKLDNYTPGVVVLPNPDNDDIKPFPLEIKKSGRPPGQGGKIGKDISIIKVAVTNAPALKLADSNQEVNSAEQVITLGYPVTADLDIGNLLKEESILEASMAEGRVSNPNKKLKDGSPVLQIDIRAAQGSVGSPVLNEQGKVIGVIAYSKFTEKETVPLAIPTSTIWEFIRQSGAANEEGVTTQQYNKGLELFWEGDYEKAKGKFEAVKRQFRYHSEADRLISRAEEKIGEQWGRSNYLFVGAILVLIMVVPAFAFFLLRRKSNLISPSSALKNPRTSNGKATGVSILNDNATRAEEYQSNGTRAQTWLELENKGKIRRLQLQKDEHRLGRDSIWADLTVPDDWEVLSRHHAILHKEGGEYRIYDGNGKTPSLNGLFIDDNTRVDAKVGYLLRNGFQLKIGTRPNEQVLLTYFNPNHSQSRAKTTRMAE